MLHIRGAVLTVPTSVDRQPLAMKNFLLIVAAAAATMPTKPVKADINDDMLQQHNDYRAKHNDDPLSMDDTVSLTVANLYTLTNLS